MNIKLKVWRQLNSDTNGSFYTYDVENVLEDIATKMVLKESKDDKTA